MLQLLRAQHLLEKEDGQRVSQRGRRDFIAAGVLRVHVTPPPSPVECAVNVRTKTRQLAQWMQLSITSFCSL